MPSNETTQAALEKIAKKIRDIRERKTTREHRVIRDGDFFRVVIE